MKPKIKKRAKHIVARSIELKDAKGKTRIFMDAGDGKGYSTICLFSNGDRSIQIAVTPEGSLHISLEGNKSFAGFNMSATEDACLNIRDKNGLLGTELGATFDSGEHNLTVFRNGQIHWTTRKRPTTKFKKAKV